jgi:hypothetical protein
MLEGDALRQQLRNILDAMEAETALFEERAAQLERDGWRIVDGGQVGTYDGDDNQVDYACTDWRMGETLFTGHGTYEDFTARLDAAEAKDGRRWVQQHNVTVQVTNGEADDMRPLEPVLVPGMPASLAELLVAWVERADPHEVAQLTGLRSVSAARRAAGGDKVPCRRAAQS